jgi:hypothetical protein
MHWTEAPSLLFDPLREICLHSDVGIVRSIVAEGSPKISVSEYNGNWNGGTTYYSLTIQVPTHVYVRVEPDIEEIEKQLLARVQRLQRDETNDFVTAVFIQPTTNGTTRVLSQRDCSYWLPGHFRLFIHR